MRAAFATGSSGLVGELDENVPVGHSRAIAAAVPSATARFCAEHGHVSILRELPSIIDDVAALAS
jgi:hypothetical protein